MATNSLVFVHEVMHLMGGRHQQCTVWVDPDCAAASGFIENLYPQNCGCEDGLDFANGWAYKTGIWPFRKEKTTVLHQRGRDGWTRQQEVSNPDVHGTQDNDVARKLEDNACNVASFVPDPLQAYISGPSVMLLSDWGTWCANISNCNGNPSLTWEVSTNGWSYSYAGSGTCITRQLNSNQLYLKLTISCDGRTITRFQTVSAEDGGLYRISSESNPIVLAEEIKMPPKINGFSNTLRVVTYPNPANSILSVVYNSIENADTEITLINMMGKSNQVWIEKSNKSTERKKVVIPISSYEPGLYILTVNNGKNIESQKILIQDVKH